MTEKQRNSAANLILLCGHHHPLVDKQWETYPATSLKEWKKAHEAKATSGTPEAIQRTADIEKHVFFEEMSDDQIERELIRIRRARHLVGFPTAAATQHFAAQVERSKYSSGSPWVRAQALAWCARLLARDETLFLGISTRSAIAQAAFASARIFTARADALAAAAETYFIKYPNQAVEGQFDAMICDARRLRPSCQLCNQWLGSRLKRSRGFFNVN